MPAEARKTHRNRPTDNNKDKKKSPKDQPAQKFSIITPPTPAYYQPLVISASVDFAPKRTFKGYIRDNWHKYVAVIALVGSVIW